jgi:hypothetical protein
LIAFSHQEPKGIFGRPLSTHRWDANSQSLSQIQQLILLLRDEAAENFSQRTCLANALLVMSHRSF